MSSITANYVALRFQACKDRQAGLISRALARETRAEAIIAQVIGDTDEYVLLNDAEEACDELACNPGTTPDEWEALETLHASIT